MESKVQDAPYQDMKYHHLNVYRAFQHPVTLSGIQKIFGDVERDAATIFNRVKTAGMKAEEPRAAVLEMAGRYVKVYSTLLVEREYPAGEKGKAFPMADYDKLAKAVGEKIKS